MTGKEVLATIREDLESRVGQKVRLRANRGRKKILERTGILEKTYPNIFVIRLEEQKSPERRISFSYTDVLTNTVELMVEGESGIKKLGAKH
ncbi:Protein Veg [Neomoorella glycerini]|uniref:Protein Veg n=1 Tax=Neomoorella glycerini TaxID=55779 RepID=A0A6I5ZQ00_9FIRM|nr:Veg family protein [Moorella glycerini]QGP92023.1 Protein Veg [Moorella glycerini]